MLSWKKLEKLEVRKFGNFKNIDRNKRGNTVREDGSQHLELLIVERPIFRNFKMSNI